MNGARKLDTTTEVHTHQRNNHLSNWYGNDTCAKMTEHLDFITCGHPVRKLRLSATQWDNLGPLLIGLI